LWDDGAVENQTPLSVAPALREFEFELRDGDLRVFYRVEDDQVMVDAIGRKCGNQLFIGGRRVIL
jgi:hypothetical protein